MHYVILGELLLYLLVALFCVFSLSKDNFVLLRKNINTERMFNMALLVFIVGLLAARIAYVALHFKKTYENPLVFFLFPYFPGLSVIAGIGIGSLFLIFYTYRSKIPTLHIFDIFTLSALCAVPFGLFAVLLGSKNIFFAIPFAVIIAFALMILISVFQSAKMKDGSVGYICLILISIALYCFQILRPVFFLPEDILFLIVFLFSVVFLLKQENILKSFKNIHIGFPKKRKKKKLRIRSIKL